MAVAASNLFCAGITMPAPASLPAAGIAGHPMVRMPGGLTVTGSAFFKENPFSEKESTHSRPRWVWNDPYMIGQMPVSESMYRDVMGRAGSEDAPGNHPVTGVSYDDVLEYLNRKGNGLVLPTEWQWEAAAGPAVNIAEVMEEDLGQYLPGLVVDFVEGRFHNFVFGILGDIFNDPTSQPFRRLIRDGRPFFGWRVHATPSGRLLDDEAWRNVRRGDDGRFRRESAPVDWGPKNAFGLHNMSGNVAEWVRGRNFETLNESCAYMLTGVNPLPHGEDGRWRICCGNIGTDESPDEHYGIAGRMAVQRGSGGIPGIGFRVAAAVKGRKPAARSSKG